MKPALFKMLIISLIFMNLQACSQKTFDEKVQGLYKNTVPLIHAAELKDADSSKLVVLDIRETEEYTISHLKNARHISYEDFESSDVQEIPKDAKIIVYCSVGYRSERIGEKLQELGYSDVQNLYGGIFDWKNKGYEVYNQNNQPTDSVHTYNRNWSQWLYNGIKVYE